MIETPKPDDRSVAMPAPSNPATDERRNYLVTVIEGGAFIGGMGFLNPQTMLPDIVQQLGGSPMLVALAPSLMMLGFWLAPVLTAHWIDGMPRFKPVVSVFGVLQRIPYLFAGLALLMALSDGSQKLALIAVVSAPLISGTAGGISVTAWQQLVARCIPERRRASVFAHRFIISSILGFCAGLTARLLFAHLSLIGAYAALHLIAFFFIAVSYAVFMLTREPHIPAAHIRTLTLRANLLLMPRLLGRNPDFRKYLASRLMRNGVLVIVPFLAIYARDVLNQPEAFLGTLAMAHMAGAVAGNLGAASLGDRYGGKLVNQLALALYIVISAWAMLSGTAAEYIAIFFVMGAAQFAGEVGTATLLLEIVPPRYRATHLAIASAVNVPGVFLAGWISSALWKNTHSIVWLAVVTIITVAASIGLLHPIREPRRLTA